MLKALTQARIDHAIAELTGLSGQETETVWLYAQPRWSKQQSARYVLLQPRLKRAPRPKEVLMLNAQIKRYYQGGGGNYFLLEIPAAYVRIYEIQDYVLSEEHLESLKPDFDMSRPW